MSGMDRITGAEIAEIDDVRQSIADILSTPLGSRIARRTYGSRLFDLVDAPGNTANRVLLYAAVATALMRWEPRIRIQRVDIAPSDALQGAWTVNLASTIVDAATSQSFRLSIVPGRSA